MQHIWWKKKLTEKRQIVNDRKFHFENQAKKFYNEIDNHFANQRDKVQKMQKKINKVKKERKQQTTDEKVIENTSSQKNTSTTGTTNSSNPSSACESIPAEHKEILDKYFDKYFQQRLQCNSFHAQAAQQNSPLNNPFAMHTNASAMNLNSFGCNIDSNPWQTNANHMLPSMFRNNNVPNSYQMIGYKRMLCNKTLHLQLAHQISILVKRYPHFKTTQTAMSMNDTLKLDFLPEVDLNLNYKT